VTAEILCIGTELLLGNITNGNARWIAEQLASLGIPHHRQTVVGDNRERLIAAVREAAGRCRLLITTGGLGPTPDDLTTEAIAAAFGAPLVEHPEVWADIQAKITARGRAVAPSNRRQAQLPLGAAVLPNPAGTAPGMVWTPPAAAGIQPGFTVLTFPGVPSELELMWQVTAVAWLRDSTLAAVPGASDVFLGGVIAYANAVKQELLEVSLAALEADGAVSDSVATAMAEGVRRRTGATWALAVTGVAGPGGGSGDKPVGLVHIALAGPAGCRSEGVRFGSSRGRSWIQLLTAGEALNRLRLAL
jgi:PncC family amidohydrolase